MKKKVFFAKPFITKKIRHDLQHRFFNKGYSKHIRKTVFLRKRVRGKKRYNKRAIMIKKTIFRIKTIKKHPSFARKNNYIRRIKQMQNYAKKRLVNMNLKQKKALSNYNQNFKRT